MDDWNIDDFNFNSMDGQWNRQAEMEVCLKTYNGTQHLRLHGWLKRNDVLIKMEQFTTEKERKGEASHFGSFIVYITENTLEKLKEENLEKGLFVDLEIFSTGEKRFETWKSLDRVTKLDEGIKDFLFDIAGSISSPEDISRFVGRANETTLKLFKRDPIYITEYIETNEMSYKHKLKDLDILIQYFEERERYEDCALILKIKEKVQTRQLLTKLQNNE